jgi:uncharacterized protein YhaN
MKKLAEQVLFETYMERLIKYGNWSRQEWIALDADEQDAWRHVAAAVLSADIDVVLAAVDKLDNRVSTIENAVSEIVSNIKPVMDEVMASPLVKMLTGGKKQRGPGPE